MVLEAYLMLQSEEQLLQMGGATGAVRAQMAL